MQNNIDNNGRDPFGEIFRKKLENHSLPVDADSWDKIQKALNAGQNRRIIPLWWWYSISGVAVAVVLLLFFLQPFQHENFKIDTANQLNNHIKIAANQIVSNDNKQAVEVNKTYGKQQSSFTTTKNKTNEPKLTANKIENTVAENSTQSENIYTEFVKEQNSEKSEMNKTEQKEHQMPDVKDTREPNEKLIASTEIQPNDWTDHIQREKYSTWSVKAQLSSGSGTTTNSPAPSFNDFTGKMGIVKAYTMNTSILTPNDFSDRTYYSPLNFGIKVSRQINEKFSLETGLTYTYLLTGFKNMNYDAELNLHYLGVPFNVVMKMLGNQKWSLYCSTGLTVEKGLRSVYIQNQYYSNQIITTTASTNIDGLQWSMNVSGGVLYRIVKNFDIYFAPRISYYFDNNQPISLRTDRKTCIEAEGGLRYNF